MSALPPSRPARTPAPGRGPRRAVDRTRVSNRARLRSAATADRIRRPRPRHLTTQAAGTSRPAPRRRRPVEFRPPYGAAAMSTLEPSSVFTHPAIGVVFALLPALVGVVALIMGGRAPSSASRWLVRIGGDRKSTRLNSSHVAIAYAVFS